MIKVTDKRNMISHEKYGIKTVHQSIQQLNIQSRQTRTINHAKIMFDKN